ncbi:hypothetical protein L3Y34_013803 [Caenorhabditis briggsae]|uniref:Uncharacterized protein n=1 Tax=Caenorhabditis briggsae TaxID=6238 RepID=A0AAE8ZXS5_CAEBR|nr:hypothetical protein L3Y34_013803 [Caenorhabditis briggsae]
MNPWRTSRSNNGWVSETSIEYVNKNGAKEAVIGIPANTTVKITYYANKQRKRVSRASGRTSLRTSSDTSDQQVRQHSRRTNSRPNENHQNGEPSSSRNSRLPSNPHAAIPLYTPYTPPYFAMSPRPTNHIQEPYIYIREQLQTWRYAPYHLRFASRGSTQPAFPISTEHVVEPSGAAIVELPGLEVRYHDENIRKFYNDTAPPKP